MVTARVLLYSLLTLTPQPFGNDLADDRQAEQADEELAREPPSFLGRRQLALRNCLHVLHVFRPLAYWTTRKGQSTLLRGAFEGS